MRPWLEPPPTVDIDRNEDGFGEEEQTLEGEGYAECLSPLPHELRPQQAELEGENCPCYRPDRERHRHVLGPALRESQSVTVAALDPPVVGNQRHRRPRHPERHQDDVERKGEGHLCPCPRNGVHLQQHGSPLVKQHICHGREPLSTTV